MALTVLFGKGRSGKTEYCFSQMRERAEQGCRTLLIVPDQASYNAERRFAESLPGKGFMGTQIVGFSRLAYRVFQEQGKDQAFVSELAQKLILQRLLRQHEESLTVLQTAARQDNFVETAGRFISECRSFCISPDMLRRAAAALGSQTLSRKLEDIALLYQGYADFLEERFGNADDMMTMLAQAIPSYSFLQGAYVWVDGFQWFTPQQLEVLRAAEQAAAHITITLTMDPDRVEAQRRETALFHRAYAVYAELRRLFPHVEVQTVKSGCTSGPSVFLNDFFRPVPLTQAEPVQAMTLTECGSRELEIDAAARRIQSLCRQGYRYRDFLILARTGDAYYHIAEQVFAKYNIPFFSDYRRPMMSHPAVEAILSLLEIFTSQWAHEPLFQLLKTDLFPISRRDADDLENYCLAYGIRGYHWLSGADWQYGRNRYAEEDHSVDEREEELLRRINGIRRSVADVLMPFWEDAKAEHSLREWCTLLYQWLSRMGVPQALRQWKADDEAAGRTAEGKEHEQVWKRILDFLGEIVYVCGDDAASLQEFARIVKDGMEQLKFSLIPPTLDHVTFTSVERGYAMQARVVFLCGLNDGVFPQHASEEGMLNDAERRRLEALGLRLGPDSRFRSFQEKFLFYLAAGRAGEQLHLSYILAGDDGSAMEPSSWVRQIEEKGYAAAVRHETGTVEAGHEDQFILSLPAALSWLPIMLRPAVEGRPVSDVWWALYDWAYVHGWKGRAVQAVQGLFHHNQPLPLPASLVRRLYAPDGVLRGSVTKFEQYRSCPFAYFARYGLLLEERPMYHFSAPDLGMLVHGALRILGEDLLREKKQWHDLLPEEIPNLCRQATERLAPYIQHDILMSNAYFAQIKERLIQTLVRTVRRLCEFSASSNFHMEGLEKAFGRKGSPWEALRFTLPDGLEVIVTGQIDRVDSMRAGDAKYVVVIDYKSGRKQLDLGQVFVGLELQLLTYMYVALLNMGEDAVPAAVLYCYVRNDKTSLDHVASDEEKKTLYDKKSRLSGYYLDDSEIMTALDTSMQGYSEFLNLRLKKDGTMSNTAHTMYNEEGWQALLDLAVRRIREIASSIDSGDISVRPILLGQTSPCRYCPYHAVCRFDVQLQDNEYDVVSIGKDEVLEALDKGGSGHGMDK